MSAVTLPIKTVGSMSLLGAVTKHICGDAKAMDADVPLEVEFNIQTSNVCVDLNDEIQSIHRCFPNTTVVLRFEPVK